MPFPGLLLLFSAVALPADAPSEAAKGAALLRGCQAEVRIMDAGPALADTETADLINGAYCVGYLNGFLTGIKPGPSSICLAKDNMGDLVRAYVHYMEQNPLLGEQDKRVGLRLALENAFPCPLNTRSLPGQALPSAPGVLQPGATPGRSGARSRHYA